MSEDKSKATDAVVDAVIEKAYDLIPNYSENDAFAYAVEDIVNTHASAILANTKEAKEAAERLMVYAERALSSNPEDGKRFQRGYHDYVVKYRPKCRSFEP